MLVIAHKDSEAEEAAQFQSFAATGRK